jgi:hypothetical protein
MSPCRAIQREFAAMTIHIFARPIVLDSALLGAAIFHKGVRCPRADRCRKIASRALPLRSERQLRAFVAGCAALVS